MIKSDHKQLRRLRGKNMPSGADEIKEPGNALQAEFAKRKVILHLTGLLKREEN